MRSVVAGSAGSLIIQPSKVAPNEERPWRTKGVPRAWTRVRPPVDRGAQYQSTMSLELPKLQNCTIRGNSSGQDQIRGAACVIVVCQCSTGLFLNPASSKCLAGLFRGAIFPHVSYHGPRSWAPGTWKRPMPIHSCLSSSAMGHKCPRCCCLGRST